MTEKTRRPTQPSPTDGEGHGCRGVDSRGEGPDVKRDSKLFREEDERGSLDPTIVEENVQRGREQPRVWDGCGDI